jgi:Holliday junction resolvasome RuvABC ATP-dependent DNA helicase subunit
LTAVRWGLLDTLSAAINEDNNTIEDVYEPYLPPKRFYSKDGKGQDSP